MTPDITLPPRASPGMRLAHVVYQIILHLLLPVALAMVVWRSRREPLYRAFLHHRFGFGPVGARGAVWVFAASLGETRAVSPLISELLLAGCHVCLTHSSPAGLAEGRRLFRDDRITHRYVPLDLFWCVWLFLVRLRPTCGLVVESEFWPGQLLLARRLGIPMVQVNGNLLNRTIERDIKRFFGLRLALFQQFAAILTKTTRYRDRYLRIGVAPDRIACPGELKFDQPVPAPQVEAGLALRKLWAGNLPVFLIASSVADEEPDLLRLVARLAPGARIVWAPRSPQRFDAVAAQLSAAGHTVARRSQVLADDLSGTTGATALVGDSLGEMAFYYALADLVFVGASLVAHGGHNIVEPLSQGRPVVMGPSIFGITFPAEDAIAAGALRLAPDAEALGDLVDDLLGDPAALAAFSEQAQGFAARYTGAARRSRQCLAPLLDRAAP